MKKDVFISCFAVFLLLFSYCSKKSPTEPETPTIRGNDGTIYKIKKIGEQIWMIENLRETKYRNGDPIPNVTSPTEWENLTTGARCYYRNDEDLVNSYGYLYNWAAVSDSRNIAPEGWHVPTDEDWKQLEMAIGMGESETNEDGYRGTYEGSNLAGQKSLWRAGKLTNNPGFGISGFAAIPGGYCVPKGYCYDLRECAYYWTATESDPDDDDVWYRAIYYNHEQVLRLEQDRQCGFSVRCVKD
jgi:uncharacterized protein (TIGR02145 family)